MDEAPLFPLRTVLFPGGPLRLKLFEPRYLDMLGRCLRGTNRFGVLAIRDGHEVGDAETFSTGTLAEVVDWREEPGGLLGITALGREPFALLERSRQPDGLYVGRIAVLEPEAPVPLPPEHAPLAALLGKLLPRLDAYATLATRYDDAVWVGQRLTEILPLSLSLKQSLLEMRDAHARLERLRESLPPPSPS